MGKDGKPSARTGYLIKSYVKGTLARVLRGHNLPDNNPYRPAMGLRYDGLYKVVSFKILDPKTAMYRFTMERVPGQSPIRHEGPGARPTLQEQDQWRKVRQLTGLAS